MRVGVRNTQRTLMPVRSREYQTTTQRSRRRTGPIFVAHGRNDAAREALFTFLFALGLEPHPWSKLLATTPEPTPETATVVVRGLARACAIVVLLTGDDEARLHSGLLRVDDPAEEGELMPQARQNVLFEAGMALSRYPERTILVRLGPLRLFSDVRGLYIINLVGDLKSRQELADALQKAGCAVNLSGSGWHSAGDFSLALAHQREAIRKLSAADRAVLACLSEAKGGVLAVEDLQEKVQFKPLHLDSILERLERIDYVSVTISEGSRRVAHLLRLGLGALYGDATIS